MPAGDFRAAVAFYPASCDTKRQGAVWQSPVPLLVLIGEQDVWTPFAPCKTLFDSVAPGAGVASGDRADGNDGRCGLFMMGA